MSRVVQGKRGLHPGSDVRRQRTDAVGSHVEKLAVLFGQCVLMTLLHCTTRRERSCEYKSVVTCRGETLARRTSSAFSSTDGSKKRVLEKKQRVCALMLSGSQLRPITGNRQISCFAACKPYPSGLRNNEEENPGREVKDGEENSLLTWMAEVFSKPTLKYCPRLYAQSALRWSATTIFCLRPVFTESC